MRARCCGYSPTEVPTGVGFMKRAGLVTEGRPEEFEALAGRCAVFRLDRNSITLNDNPFHAEDWKPVDGFAS